jgi:hypothetical protein
MMITVRRMREVSLNARENVNDIFWRRRVLVDAPRQCVGPKWFFFSRYQCVGPSPEQLLDNTTATVPGMISQTIESNER